MRADSRTFLTSWIVANSWAEAAGLGTTFVVGGWLAPWLANQSTVVGALATAALAILFGTLLEGVVVGAAQERVLAASLPLRRGSWTRATAAGAGAAWVLGMIPSTVMALRGGGDASVPPPEIPALAQYALGALLGAVTGPLLGFAQWAVLRRSVDDAVDWLMANAVAWAAGMPLIFLGMDYVPWQGSPIERVVAIYAVCAATGAVVGAIHGPVLQSLLRHPRQRGIDYPAAPMAHSPQVRLP